MNELVGGLGYAVKNWWMSLLLGLLYIAVAPVSYTHLTLPTNSLV